MKTGKLSYLLKSTSSFIVEVAMSVFEMHVYTCHKTLFCELTSLYKESEK